MNITPELIIAFAGLGLTWLSLTIKIISDSRKKVSCPLDRSQSIFKINVMEQNMDKISEKLAAIKTQATEGINIAKTNGAHGEKSVEIQQATAIYLQQLLEQQKKTNELLEAIRRNGNGKS